MFSSGNFASKRSNPCVFRFKLMSSTSSPRIFSLRLMFRVRNSRFLLFLTRFYRDFIRILWYRGLDYPTSSEIVKAIANGFSDLISVGGVEFAAVDQEEVQDFL